MLDRNNLNRIKGILSARQGAEIPKFEEGAKFAMYNGSQVIYSADQSSWFTDEALSLKYPGSLGGFKSIQYTPTTKKQPLKPAAHVSLAIPGEPDVTPTSAVETAAANAASAQQKEGQLSEAEYLKGERYQPIPLGENPLAGLNSPPVLDLGLATVDLDASAERSAKMRLDQLAQDQAKKEARYATAGQIAGAALQGIGAAVGANQKATDSDTTKMIDTAYNTAAEGIKQAGPVGQLVGTAMQMGQVAGDIIQSLGGGTDQQTAADRWMDSALFSWNIGMLNGFAGKNTQDFGVDQSTMSQVGSSYGDSVNAISEAANKAGKKYGLFSTKARKKADAAINLARSQQNAMGDIADTAAKQRLAVQSMGEQAGLAYSMMTSGGYDQKYTYAAKQGGILNWEPQTELEWEPQIELNWELPTFKEGGNIDINEELEWIPEFKNGGKTEDSDVPEIEETNQKNVIPEGALHKNKHHMEHAEGLTKKGIPVIDDDGDQQAEIEHSEIIFTLEVTNKLEEYYKIFYSDEATNKEKDEAALNAGKLLVYQILENTEDRTGLIDSCKKGGSLTLKKSTDTLIEEVLEEMPTMVIIEEEVKEKPKKKEGKLDKELMKEAIKEVLIELVIK